MKVCGFTFIRNAIKLDFPVVEAITSVLPLCDFFVVAAGNSDDNTRELIKAIDPGKILIVDTLWNDRLTQGGKIYAEETNKAFDAIPPEYDWCFYIQGDEVLHEKYLEPVKKAMLYNLERREVEGLLFEYLHFFGSYNYVGDSRKWYRNEIRIIRNDKSIRSYRDAQGFRKQGRKLKVVPANAIIYHYGWVRPPVYMQDKIDEVKKYYLGDLNATTENRPKPKAFDYSGNYDALALFAGTHPRVMHQRIKQQNWKIEVDLNKVKMKPRYRFLYYIEKKFGVRLFEYKNYKLLS